MPRSLFDYTVVSRRDDNGSFVAHVPAIPGCHALGASAAEAQTALADVYEMIAEEYAERGDALPADVELTVAHARQVP